MPTASFIESPWAFATLTQMLVSYPALTGRASWIIYALTRGRPRRYSITAESFSSLYVSPAFQEESSSFDIAITKTTSL
ncbi:MAG: hypothetical protein RXR41_04455 [Candidatus Marsarchaeota archaeon]